ncbi:hypothetical protein P43SY_006139 [Pythium insidiosum]|uniref:Peptidase S1 domain-containing protein n=1 Tax=Pythium insidiosum TaxID=114742 RepID=A0AAD5M257_PYTIN|nr:hypothetical protein P43SY_006139 [Pythium insidiosum]
MDGERHGIDESHDCVAVLLSPHSAITTTSCLVQRLGFGSPEGASISVAAVALTDSPGSDPQVGDFAGVGSRRWELIAQPLARVRLSNNTKLVPTFGESMLAGFAYPDENPVRPLIAPQYVLTAAHCVSDNLAKWVSIGYGWPHKFSYDVAVLELKYSSSGQPIVLDASQDIQDGLPPTLEERSNTLSSPVPTPPSPSVSSSPTVVATPLDGLTNVTKFQFLNYVFGDYDYSILPRVLIAPSFVLAPTACVEHLLLEIQSAAASSSTSGSALDLAVVPSVCGPDEEQPKAITVKSIKTSDRRPLESSKPETNGSIARSLVVLVLTKALREHPIANLATRTPQSTDVTGSSRFSLLRPRHAPSVCSLLPSGRCVASMGLPAHNSTADVLEPPAYWVCVETVSDDPTAGICLVDRRGDRPDVGFLMSGDGDGSNVVWGVALVEETTCDYESVGHPSATPVVAIASARFHGSGSSDVEDTQVPSWPPITPPWVTPDIVVLTKAKDHVNETSDIAIGYLITLRHVLFHRQWFPGDASAIKWVTLSTSEQIPIKKLWFESEFFNKSDAFQAGLETEPIAIYKDKIRIHPSFGSPYAFSFDAAILELQTAAYSRGVALDDSKDFSSGPRATMYGYGVMGPNSNVLSPTVRVLDLPVLSKQDCKSKLPNIDDSVLCAGGEGANDACKGDSGGPLVLSKREDVLVGLVSAGYGCGMDGVPGMYTRISSIREFIDAYAYGTQWGLPTEVPTLAPAPTATRAKTVPPTAFPPSERPDSSSPQPTPTLNTGSLQPYWNEQTGSARTEKPVAPTGDKFDSPVNSKTLPRKLPPALREALMRFFLGEMYDGLQQSSGTLRGLLNPTNEVQLYSTGGLDGITDTLTQRSSWSLYNRRDRFGTMSSSSSSNSSQKSRSSEKC